MLLFATLLVLGSAIAENINLEAGKIFTYSTPGYPNVRDEPGKLVFKFRAAPGSKIITYCEDFRVVSDNKKECDYFEMNINDGVKQEKFCKSSRNLHFKTTGPTLDVEIKFTMRQMVSCVARSTEAPKGEEIVLTPENHEYMLESPRKPFPYMDQIWTFKSSNGEKVNLKCQTNLRQWDECHRESVTIDTGAAVNQYCDRDSPDLESAVDSVTLRVVMDKQGHSFFRCYATIPSNGLDQFYDPPVVVEPTHHEVTLRAGQTHKFESPGYPYGDSSSNSYNIFHFKTSPGSQILVNCDDIRMSSSSENPCDQVELKFNDDKNVQKVCGVNYNVFHISTKNTLDVEMKFKHAVAVSCLARTTEEPNPTEVVLSQFDNVYRFKELKTPVGFYDAVWVFKGEGKTRISIQCEITFNDRKPCASDFFTVDTGREKKTFCGPRTFVLFSERDTLKVRVQLDKFGHERYTCMVQAVTGSNANQHKNTISEEVDSSERGGKPGRVATTCNCGRRNHVKGDGRIFNGKETQVSEYTWMVGIRDHDNFQRCGGSLISQYHVLTAAHCMVDEFTRLRNETFDTVVAIGAHSTREDAKHGDTQHITVKEIFIPEEYWNFGRNYDVSVLFLEKAAVYGPNVGPVCMPKLSPKINNREIKLTGWGRTETQEASPVLKETKLFVIDHEICGMDPWFICTYKNYTSSCKGDSGSPLVHWDEDTNRYFQVSIVSFGRTYECTADVSGNSNVTYHYEWIYGMVKRTMPSVELCTKLE